MDLTYQQQLTYLRNFKNSVDKRGLKGDQICILVVLYSLQRPLINEDLKSFVRKGVMLSELSSDEKINLVRNYHNRSFLGTRAVPELIRKGLIVYNLSPLEGKCPTTPISLTKLGQKWIQMLLYAFNLSDPRDVSGHKDEIVMIGLKLIDYMQIFSGKNRIEVLFRIYKEPHLTKGELEQKIGKKIPHSLKQEEENTLIISSKNHSTAVKKYTVSEWTSEVLHTILSPSHILTPFLPS